MRRDNQDKLDTELEQKIEEMGAAIFRIIDEEEFKCIEELQSIITEKKPKDIKGNEDAKASRIVEGQKSRSIAVELKPLSAVKKKKPKDIKVQDLVQVSREDDGLGVVKEQKLKKDEVTREVVLSKANKPSFDKAQEQGFQATNPEALKCSSVEEVQQIASVDVEKHKVSTKAEMKAQPSQLVAKKQKTKSEKIVRDPEAIYADFKLCLLSCFEKKITKISAITEFKEIPQEIKFKIFDEVLDEVSAVNLATLSDFSLRIVKLQKLLIIDLDEYINKTSNSLESLAVIKLETSKRMFVLFDRAIDHGLVTSANVSKWHNEVFSKCEFLLRDYQDFFHILFLKQHITHLNFAEWFKTLTKNTKLTQHFVIDALFPAMFELNLSDTHKAESWFNAFKSYDKLDHEYLLLLFSQFLYQSQHIKIINAKFLLERFEKYDFSLPVDIGNKILARLGIDYKSDDILLIDEVYQEIIIEKLRQNPSCSKWVEIISDDTCAQLVNGILIKFFEIEQVTFANFIDKFIANEALALRIQHAYYCLAACFKAESIDESSNFMIATILNKIDVHYKTIIFSYFLVNGFKKEQNPELFYPQIKLLADIVYLLKSDNKTHEFELYKKVILKLNYYGFNKGILNKSNLAEWLDTVKKCEFDYFFFVTMFHDSFIGICENSKNYKVNDVMDFQNLFSQNIFIPKILDDELSKVSSRKTLRERFCDEDVSKILFFNKCHFHIDVFFNNLAIKLLKEVKKIDVSDKAILFQALKIVRHEYDLPVSLIHMRVAQVVDFLSKQSSGIDIREQSQLDLQIDKLKSFLFAQNKVPFPQLLTAVIRIGSKRITDVLSEGCENYFRENNSLNALIKLMQNQRLITVVCSADHSDDCTMKNLIIGQAFHAGIIKADKHSFAQLFQGFNFEYDFVMECFFKNALSNGSFKLQNISKWIDFFADNLPNEFFESAVLEPDSSLQNIDKRLYYLYNLVIEYLIKIKTQSSEIELPDKLVSSKMEFQILMLKHLLDETNSSFLFQLDNSIIFSMVTDIFQDDEISLENINEKFDKIAFEYYEHRQPGLLASASIDISSCPF